MTDLANELRVITATLTALKPSDLTAEDRERLQELLVAAADLLWPSYPRSPRPREQWWVS